MLMVLMAMLEFGKTKVHKATRWVWLLLSGGLFAGGAVSCGGGGGNDGTGKPDAIEEVAPPLYGPPPDLGPDNPVDAPQPLDVPKDCEPKTYYGPPPCQSDEECVKQYGGGWYCDKGNKFEDPCGPVSWPMCKFGDTVDVPKPDVPAKDCEPMTYYGPPPCQSDEECIKEYGPNWYCDKGNQFADPCGPINWPMCKSKVDVDVPPLPDVAQVDCGEPKMYYGPKPCMSDEECIKDNGAGWYCEKSYQIDPPCGPVWPMCQQKPDVDVPVSPDVTKPDCGEPKVYYGPKPCMSDDECIKDNGAGWYCDKSYQIDPPCGPVWPTCQQKPDVDVPPTDAQVDCGNGPIMLYGPPPCTDDEWCHQKFGPDYYCPKIDPCLPAYCEKKE